MTLRRVLLTIPGGGNVVDRERIIREGLENFPLALDGPVLRARIVQDEFAPEPQDVPGLAARFSEIELVPLPVDLMNGVVRNVITETMPIAVERFTAIVAVVPEQPPTPVDNSGRLYVNAVSPANAVVSNTAFTNPQNVLDDDADEATATATATGVGGTTAVQVQFELTVSFADFAFTYLDDITQASIVMVYRIQASATAVLPTQGFSAEYSIDDGANWVVFWGVTTQQPAGSTATVDLLPAVGDDWNKINQLRVRVSGFVRSGTGVGANNVCAIQRIRMQFQAHKNFT